MVAIESSCTDNHNDKLLAVDLLTKIRYRISFD